MLVCGCGYPEWICRITYRFCPRNLLLSSAVLATNPCAGIDGPVPMWCDRFMPKAFETWTVLGHEPIEELAENLWSVLGDLPSISLKRVMVVARMQDGRLLIHNAIALEEELMKTLEAWGAPAFIVVPNGWHRLDCAAYKERYPDARIVCPAGARKRVEQVVPVDLTYDEFQGDESVSLSHVPGMKDVEGVLTVRSAGGVTLVFNDLVFNVPHQSGVSGLIFRILGSTGGPKVTGLMRRFVIKDRKAVRERLADLAETPDLVRIIPGHGVRIEEDAAATLRRIAGAL
jgi:hypothetical protein